MSAATNLLFLYTDEQAFRTLQAYGNDRIAMPNLNRLARQACIFNQAYVTQPVCTPSRSSLLTGLYPHSNGCTANNLVLPSAIPCLPELLSSGRYHCGHYGKWHLGDELFAQHGFTDWVSIEDAYNRWFTPGRDFAMRSSYHHFLVGNGIKPQSGELFGRGETARLAEEWSKPAFLAGEACRFLRTNSTRPFVLFLNFLEPHMPFFGPRDDQYRPEDIPLPDNFAAIPGAEQPLKLRFLQQYYQHCGTSGLPLRTSADWQRLIANYWGLCSLIDTHIGRVLDCLDELELAENTIIVFTSDHGDMMGAHQLVAKCVLYEESARVPMLLRLPGQRQACRINGPVSQIDLVPTLLELLGEKVPDHLQGKSLVPALRDPAGFVPRPVCVEWLGVGTGAGNSLTVSSTPTWLQDIPEPVAQIRQSCAAQVRSVISPDQWKFNCANNDEHELYNLQQDPGERHNLASQPDTRAVRFRLRQMLSKWQQQTGDTLTLPE